MAAPLAIAPAMTMTPSNIARMRGTSARWLIDPEWPPPPAPIAITPSTPGRWPFRKPQRGNVVEDQAAPSVNLRDHRGRVAPRGDDDRDLVSPARIQRDAACRGRHPDRDVRREWTDKAVRVRQLRAGECGADRDELGLELVIGAGVVASQRADQARLATLDDEPGTAHQEHRRNHRRKREPPSQGVRKRHGLGDPRTGMRVTATIELPADHRRPPADRDP